VSASRRPREAEFFRTSAKTNVESPERNTVQFGSSKELNIAPAQAEAEETMTFQKIEHIARRTLAGIEQRTEIRQRLRTVAEVADREFTEHDGMRDDFSAAKQSDHFRRWRSKMSEPDRCIHEDEHGSVLRRGWALAWREFKIGHGATKGGKTALGGMTGELFVEQREEKFCRIVDVQSLLGLAQLFVRDVYGDAHRGRLPRHSGFFQHGFKLPQFADDFLTTVEREIAEVCAKLCADGSQKYAKVVTDLA